MPVSSQNRGSRAGSTIHILPAESALRLGNDFAVTGRPQNCQFWRARLRACSPQPVARRQYRGRGRVHRGRGAGGNGVGVPAAGSLPGEGWLAAAFGIAVIVSLAWGAVGWTGTVLKSAAVASAVMLLWTTIVQVQVDYYATMMPKLRVPSATCCPAPPSTSSRCCSTGQLRGRWRRR